MSGHVNIRAVAFILFVVNYDILLLRNLIFLHVRLHIFPSSIGRSIIYINDMIILVLLLEDRVEVSQVKSVFGVIEGGQINADPDLVVDILVCLVFFVVKLSFFVDDFL
jgi:hypothetical protein